MIKLMTCPMCNNANLKTILSQKYHDVNFTVVQCSNNTCQHGFITPIPSLDVLEYHYSSDNTNDACKRDDTYVSKSLEHYNNLFTNVINPIFQKTGKLLDVGAGTGVFVASAQNNGWDATGVEFNKTAVQIAKDKFKVNMFAGNLYGLEKFFPYESFDVISFIHVFEHIIDPVSYVKYISKFLKPDGCIFIAVPNMGSDDFQKYGSKWTYLHIPAHISYFTCNSLDKVFLDNEKLGKLNFKKEFQSTFPPSGMKEGEAITAIYRLVERITQ